MAAQPCEHFHVHIQLSTAGWATKKETSATATINLKSSSYPPIPNNQELGISGFSV